METPDQNHAPKEPQKADCPSASCSPSSIYLQWHGDSEPSDDPVCITEVTWHWESIFAHDVQYIRADLVENLVLELESCLMLPANILPALNALGKILPENDKGLATQPAPQMPEKHK